MEQLTPEKYEELSGLQKFTYQVKKATTGKYIFFWIALALAIAGSFYAYSI